jgi:hypothetical protein
MRRTLAILSFLVLISAISVGIPCGRSLLAQSGCCKERDSYRSPWRRIPLDFETCRRLNQERDRDNVSEERGFIWWDTQCR